MGGYARQELEGEFIEPEGVLFKREWFRVIDEEPQGLTWVRPVDLAVSVKDTADRTATAKMARRREGQVVVSAGLAARMEWPDARRVLIDLAKTEKSVLVVERVASQLMAVQDLRRDPEIMANGIGIVEELPEPSGAGKVGRWRAVQAEAANHGIELVRGAWVADFLDEVCSVTGEMTHAHDDWMDMLAMGYKHLPAVISAESLRRPPQGLLGQRGEYVQLAVEGALSGTQGMVE